MSLGCKTEERYQITNYENDLKIALALSLNQYDEGGKKEDNKPNGKKSADPELERGMKESLEQQDFNIPFPNDVNGHPRKTAITCLNQTMFNPLGCGNCFMWAWMMAVFLEPDSDRKTAFLLIFGEIDKDALNFVNAVRGRDMRIFLAFMNSRLRPQEPESFKNTRSYRLMSTLRRLSDTGPNEKYFDEMMMTKFVRYISNIIGYQYYLSFTNFKEETLTQTSFVSPKVIGNEWMDIEDSYNHLLQSEHIVHSVVLHGIHFETPSDQSIWNMVMCHQLGRMQRERIYTNTVFKGVTTEVIEDWTYSKDRSKKKGNK